MRSKGQLLRFPRDGGNVSGIRTNAAAELLGVSPNTLRSWERRFGYPTPRRTSGGHRQYDLAELEALRQAFEETHNISSAISIARERGEGPTSAVRLTAVFKRFDEQRANRLMEESLALRTVVLTVELDPGRLAHALRALDPRALVLTGRRASLDALGRLVYAARSSD